MPIDPADVVPIRPHRPARPAPARLGWVDLAKGWCIVLVVMMHSTLGVGLALDATGWTHAVVAFAKPFRMPDFFLISGLFAAPALRLSWRDYLDKRVVHFAYFYALWLAIVLAAKAPELGLVAPGSYLAAYVFGLVEPFSSLWFIHVLPVFFVAYRLAASSRLAMGVALACAAGLHLLAAYVPAGGAYANASKLTAWTTLNETALFLIYFLIGGALRGRILALADAAARRPFLTLAALGLWVPLQILAVRTGFADVPGPTLLVGLAGAGAVVAAAALLSRAPGLGWLAYCGRHSLTIYVAFVLPMAATRIVLLATGLVTSPGWASLIVTAAAVVGPLLLARLVRDTPLRVLFERPAWAHLPRAAIARRPAPASALPQVP